MSTILVNGRERVGAISAVVNARVFRFKAVDYVEHGPHTLAVALWGEPDEVAAYVRALEERGDQVEKMLEPLGHVPVVNLALPSSELQVFFVDWAGAHLHTLFAVDLTPLPFNPDQVSGVSWGIDRDGWRPRLENERPDAAERRALAIAAVACRSTASSARDAAERLAALRALPVEPDPPTGDELATLEQIEADVREGHRGGRRAEDD